ncbi:MAG: CotH kinase family protein [Verrucomicrobia bacterium]|nr:CotH kinase family protein [Verrucomicrobiota bacterium]
MMTRPLHLRRLWPTVLSLAITAVSLQAQIVINEIFYNAPNDLDDLQWVEIHNASEQPADLGGWTLDEGKLYTFPPGTALAGKGYVVVALNTNRFAEVYSDHALGPLQRPLKRGGEKLQLRHNSGKLVDVVRYDDRAPWPVSADGYSASLERICPTVSSEGADNWAASPLPLTPKPSGTPGRQNARFSLTVPPVVAIDPAATDLGPAQPLPVVAAVQGKVRLVELLYGVVAEGADSQEAAVQMTKTSGVRYRGIIPPQPSGTLLRGPDKAAVSPARGNAPGFGPRGGGPGMSGRGPRPNFGGPGRQEPRPTRGASALVYVDPAQDTTTVFDHISTVPRNNDRGFKVFFHKDHTLAGASSVNLVFEGSEWSLLAETMAYDVYRRAGCPAPLTEFVRVWVDGALTGHHLMVERINRSFLRRNQIDDTGNLYKALWMGRNAVGRHEKRTYETTGHGDLLDLLAQLDQSNNDPDQQWQVIQANFDVGQVATYFAVNMVLSHWDGFFNNYFTYHDPQRGQWQMYPWDQDKTWGYYDGLPDDQVFFDLPLTFGMEGDRPPEIPQTPGQAGPGRENRGGGFGGGRGGPRWWRQGGYFSRPLLANPHFRKVFLEKTARVLREVYTEERYSRLLDELAQRLEADVMIRAKLRGEQPDTGKQLLARDVQLLKTHLIKRREYLLQQPELSSSAGSPK